MNKKLSSVDMKIIYYFFRRNKGGITSRFGKQNFTNFKMPRGMHSRCYAGYY